MVTPSDTPHHVKGFTITELLVVIVVIAILATLSIVAYNGVQERTRDSRRKQDIATIQEALELYYADNGEYPNTGLGSTIINSSWATTADASWSTLETLVASVGGRLPRDPTPTTGVSLVSGASVGYGYAYFGFTGTGYCTSSKGQGYILLYRLEGESNANRLDACPGTALGPYAGASNIRIVR